MLSAVECHTTLRKGSGPVDQAVFIADKISWDREGRPPYYDFLRELAGKSLEQACLWFIQYQLDHQLLLMPHRWIMEAYEDLKAGTEGTARAE